MAVKTSRGRGKGRVSRRADADRILSVLPTDGDGVLTKDVAALILAATSPTSRTLLALLHKRYVRIVREDAAARWLRVAS